MKCEACFAPILELHTSVLNGGPLCCLCSEGQKLSIQGALIEALSEAWGVDATIVLAKIERANKKRYDEEFGRK